MTHLDHLRAGRHAQLRVLAIVSHWPDAWLRAAVEREIRDSFAHMLGAVSACQVHSLNGKLDSTQPAAAAQLTE